MSRLPTTARMAGALIASALIMAGGIPVTYAQAQNTPAPAVVAQVSLQSSTLDCHGTVSGVVTVNNGGNVTISIERVHVYLLDMGSGFSSGESLGISTDVNPSNPQIAPHSSAQYSFTLTMVAGMTTPSNPEPGQVDGEPYYVGSAGHAVGAIGSAGVSITGCPRTASTGAQQASSAVHSAAQNATQAVSSASSLASSAANNIPEFPVQFAPMIALTLAMLVAYLWVRRAGGMASSKPSPTTG
jgi:hypothetical protein